RVDLPRELRRIEEVSDDRVPVRDVVADAASIYRPDGAQLLRPDGLVAEWILRVEAGYCIPRPRSGDLCARGARACGSQRHVARARRLDEGRPRRPLMGRLR